MKNDYVFKKIFSYNGNTENLRDFLSVLLEMEIKEIEVYHDTVLEKELEEEKYGILDVKAKLNNNIEVDIEIQVKNFDNMIERTTFYSTRMLSSQLKSGEEYEKINPVIIVAILDFECFPFEEYITKAVTVAEKHRECIVNKYHTYYYVELPKFRKKKLDIENKLEQWLTFIDGENEKGLKEIMEKNDKIKRANEELKYLSEDEIERRRAELREKAIRDMASAKHYGFTQGLKEGENIGRKKEKIKIAKSMLAKKVDINTISELTGLLSEEIEELK